MQLPKILILSSLFLVHLSSAAQSDFSTRDFSPSPARQSNFVDDEVFKFSNDDSVRISGVKERTNLIVTNHRGSNNVYFMPLGLVNANYSVNRDRIQLILKNGKRHALIYKLDYTTYSGKKAYQIITIRLANGLKAQNNTCTMSFFDSQSAFSDFSGTAEQRQAHLWEKAEQSTHENQFNTCTCIPAEDHSEERSTQPSIDLNEGDSMESSI